METGTLYPRGGVETPEGLFTLPWASGSTERRQRERVPVSCRCGVERRVRGKGNGVVTNTSRHVQRPLSRLSSKG